MPATISNLIETGDTFRQQAAEVMKQIESQINELEDKEEDLTEDEEEELNNLETNKDKLTTAIEAIEALEQD